MKTNFWKDGILLRRLSKNSLWILGSLILVAMQGCKKDDPRPRVRDLDLELVADNFVSPIGLVAVPDNSKRLFVIDQIGKIWIIDKHGNTLPNPFLDVSPLMVPLNPNFDERGLLGLAFHPNYKHNGRFYIYYNLPPRPGGPQPGVLWNNLSRISEFRVSGNPDMGDLSTEKILIQVDDPQFNHNGGTIAFGPDGYLYIAIGDGGAANDVAPGHVTDWYLPNAGGNGQDLDSNLFGSILRIDVNSGNPYGIPRDNPFVNRSGLDEIYAFGFRNPFRFSFDMGGARHLYAGDAGQVLYEEVSIVKKGGNYGWNVKEGTHCFNAANNLVEMPSCPDFDNEGRPLIDPIIEFNNWQNPAGGISTTVIGGNVYRGHEINGLQGAYLFGSFSQIPSTASGELFVARPKAFGLWDFVEVPLKSFPDDLGHYLKGFGQDNKGEIYLTVSGLVGPSGNTGKVYKLVEARHGNHGDD